MLIKLENLGILGDIRERLGAKDENDTSYDKEISTMGSKEAVAKWSAWNLGDESFAEEIIGNYKELRLSSIIDVKKEMEEHLIASSFDGKVHLETAFHALDRIMKHMREVD